MAVIDPTVRRAAAADAEQLVELEREARTALVEQKGGRRWLGLHAARGEAWGDVVTDDLVLVAHIDDVLVGYLVGSSDPPVARIIEVYVTPGAREVGFGDTMLETIVKVARDAGCSSIEGEALPGDRETKNLYERGGITARLIVLAKDLN